MLGLRQVQCPGTNAEGISGRHSRSIHWPEDRTHIERVWKEGNGDCRQELVLIGRDMDPQALTTMLDECLLTDEELSTDKGAWHLRFTDPFPEWTLESDGMAG